MPHIPVRFFSCRIPVCVNATTVENTFMKNTAFVKTAFDETIE
jgi:hypothetical protein